MKRVQYGRLRSVCQSLLLAVLLCAQTGLLAHQFDHAPGLDDTPCATCSIGSQLQHGAVDQSPAPEDSEALHVAPASPADTFVSIAVARATARGPPALH